MPQKVCDGEPTKEPEAALEVCADSAAKLQDENTKARAASGDSILIILIGNWKEEMVTIHTFITQKADQFINLIRQRNWKIKWMLIRNQGQASGGGALSLNNLLQPDA